MLKHWGEGKVGVMNLKQEEMLGRYRSLYMHVKRGEEIRKWNMQQNNCKSCSREKRNWEWLRVGDDDMI